MCITACAWENWAEHFCTLICPCIFRTNFAKSSGMAFTFMAVILMCIKCDKVLLKVQHISAFQNYTYY